VDSEAAYKYKKGRAPIEEAVIVEEVYTDEKKGLVAGEEDLQKVFGTTDKKEVCAKIIKQGTVNISTEYRNKLIEQKKKQVIDVIRTKAYNPRDDLPIPPARIENAMKEAKTRIDIFKSAEEQAKEIVEEISKIIPISMKSLTVALHIPARYAGKAYNAFDRYGRITKQEWQSNGSLKIHVQIPAGRKQDLISKANELTHGDLDITQVS
jgi:ribosome maturation protein SDO1